MIMLETYLEILYYCKSEKNVCTSKARAHAKKKNPEPRALSDISLNLGEKKSLPLFVLRFVYLLILKPYTSQASTAWNLCHIVI